MSDTAPITPMKRSLAMLLGLFILLVSFGSLYFKLANPSPPHWTGLALPLVTAGIALLWWTYPPATLLAPPWRQRVAAFFFALAAFELIIFFV